MSTRERDASSGDRSEFIANAMDDESAKAGGPAATSHAGKIWLRRPPPWLIAAAASLVVGLIIGLLVGGGDSYKPVAAVPSTSAPAATGDTSETPPLPVTALAHVVPVQVVIPAIQVDSPLVDLGLNTDGTLEVPVNFDKAGWFTGGNYPGDPSGVPGLIAGHVDDQSGPAVFYDLKKLVAGDEVQVVRADNTVAVFVVTSTAQYPKNAFPADQVYAPVAASELVLVTCTGAFDEAARSYLDNFVVRAQLNMERSLEESSKRVAEGAAVPAVDQQNV